MVKGKEPPHREAVRADVLGLAARLGSGVGVGLALRLGLGLG